MLKLAKIVIIFSVLLAATQTIKAQHTEWDLGMWNSLSIKMKWSRKISSELNFQTRWDNNISSLKTAFADLGIAYKYNKHITFSGNYRYGQRDFRPVTDLDHRFNIDIALDKPKKWLFHLKRTDFSLRLREQAEWAVRNNNFQQIEHTFRSKVMAKYNVKNLPLNPFVSGELFMQLNKTYYQFGETPKVASEFDKYRLKIGTEWDLSKKHSVSVAYILQHKFNSPSMQSVLVCSYTWNAFKRSKQKKQEEEGIK